MNSKLCVECCAELVTVRLGLNCALEFSLNFAFA